MDNKAFQDHYPDHFSHCYGCGRLNPDGLHIKSYWGGDESVCHFTPEEKYSGGMPESMYGGLIASLIDCHGAGTAAAAKYRSEMEKKGEKAFPRFVTASLKVDYLLPTPMHTELELRGKVLTIDGRKVRVQVDLSAEDRLCARGEVLMIQLKEDAASRPAEKNL